MEIFLSKYIIYALYTYRSFYTFTYVKTRTQFVTHKVAKKKETIVVFIKQTLTEAFTPSPYN